jgi:nucleoside-diphosphate-sugar epimerase
VFGGNQWRPLLGLEDASDAYIKVIESQNTTTASTVYGRIYNVGSEDQNYTIAQVAVQVAKGIKEVSGMDIPVKIEGSSVDARDYRVSFKKIRNELGFEVKQTISGAAKEIWMKLESKEIKDPRQKIYYNHYFDSSEELIG